MIAPLWCVPNRLPPAVPGHRAQSTFFCRGDIAVVVGIRKIRAKGIVIFAGFPQKLCRPTVSISWTQVSHKPRAFLLDTVPYCSSFIQMEQPVQNSLSSVLLRSTLLCHGWATGFQGHLPRSFPRAICAECPVQFLCKTAFANSQQAGYNNFVQRVALMRKTGCMRAARCFFIFKMER